MNRRYLNQTWEKTNLFLFHGIVHIRLGSLNILLDAPHQKLARNESSVFCSAPWFQSLHGWNPGTSRQVRRGRQGSHQAVHDQKPHLRFQLQKALLWLKTSAWLQFPPHSQSSALNPCHHRGKDKAFYYGNICINLLSPAHLLTLLRG